VNVTVINELLTPVVWQSFNQLQRDSVKCTFTEMLRTNTTAQEIVYRTEEPKGVDRSMEHLLKFMSVAGFAVRQGYVYAQPPGARFTYERADTVENFVHQVQGNGMCRGLISIGHISSLISIMSHPQFSMMPQIEIDYDLIEVCLGNTPSLPPLPPIPPSFCF
jgi:hypothetical protein